METRFLKRIIQATEDLDTSIYLNASSFENAMSLWLKDFSDALNHTVNIFEKFNFKLTANFLDKRNEQIHKEYLEKLVQYIEGIDLVFSRKAIQYAKIALKLHGPKDLTADVLEDIEEAKTYLKKFKVSLEKINKFSYKLMLYAKENKIESLFNYKYQFTRLALFEKLTVDLAIKLLKEKSEI